MRMKDERAGVHFQFGKPRDVRDDRGTNERKIDERARSTVDAAGIPKDSIDQSLPRSWGTRVCSMAGHYYNERRPPILFLLFKYSANNFTINLWTWRRTAIGRIGSGCSANIELFDIKYLCWLCHAIFEECWKTLDPPRHPPPLLPPRTSFFIFLRCRACNPPPPPTPLRTASTNFRRRTPTIQDPRSDSPRAPISTFPGWNLRRPRNSVDFLVVIVGARETKFREIRYPVALIAIRAHQATRTSARSPLRLLSGTFKVEQRWFTLTILGAGGRFCRTSGWFLLTKGVHLISMLRGMLRKWRERYKGCFEVVTGWQ